MTAVGRPTFHLPARRDPEWQARAACTPAPAWTSDTKPPQLDELRGICASCAVRIDCAQDALADGAKGGVYAGVYLPAKDGPELRAGREDLRAVAVGMVIAGSGPRARRRRRERRELSLQGGAS